MPFADYKPGYGEDDLSDVEVTAIDVIVARYTSCEALPDIDPFEGVLPTVYWKGMNRRSSAEIRLSLWSHPDRVKNGQDRVNAMADEVKAVLGYPVQVWMVMEDNIFHGESERKKEH